jgi:hypothetical protein
MWKPRACLAGLLAALVAPACAERPAPDAPPVAGAPSTPGAPVVAGALQFIEDDAPLALAEAKRRGVPIFVEAWAPW